LIKIQNTFTTTQHHNSIALRLVTNQLPYALLQFNTLSSIFSY